MKKYLFISIFLLGCFAPRLSVSQICLGESILTCPGDPVSISALCSGGGGSPVFLLDSMQQVFLSDDEYSGAINIGFPFTFYGNVYNQLVISSNNYVSFDVSQANGYSPWSITAAAPSAALPVNVVMGPYQDINPGIGGTIEYGIYGAAPNRRFVVRYNQVPMFSCTNDLFCSTMMLYEGTNHIEIYIDNKPLCPTWNNGVAIEGIQDQTGTQAEIIPGRNFPTQWTAFADGAQIFPTNPGVTTYSSGVIPYIPSLLASGVQWWDTDGNFLGTGFEITVTPTNDTTGYYVVYDQCYTVSGGQGNADTAWVYTNQPSIITSTTDITCVDTLGTAIAFASGFGTLIYQWDDPLNQVGDTAFNLNAGTYTVTVMDSNGCTAQAIATVDSLYYNLTMSSITTQCNGDSSGMAYINLNPQDTNVSYLWDINTGSQITDTAYGLSAGIYQVVITDSIGCQDSAQVVVNDATPITLTDSIFNPLCNGGSDGSISVIAQGGTPNYIYSWGSNQLTGLSAGSYSITVTDSNNCSISDTFLITDPAALALFLDTISASCGLNDGLITSVVQGGTPNYIYMWNPGGIGSDTLNNIGTGMYSLTVVDANGCTATDSIFVNEVKDFSVDFSLTPNQGIVPLTVSFSNNSFNCATYYWEFDNGNTSILFNPFDEIYTQEGEYQVTLIGCNSSGLDRCCDTVVKTVIVENNSSCNWSNVFTPNGDSFNNVFKIDCDKIVEFHIVIFNRWGNVVFESNDINNSWDGSNSGKDVPEGTYFFIIDAKGVDDIQWRHKGSVSLIR